MKVLGKSDQFLIDKDNCNFLDTIKAVIKRHYFPFSNLRVKCFIHKAINTFYY